MTQPAHNTDGLSVVIEIPPELLPALRVELGIMQAAGASIASVEEYMQIAANELLRQRCEIYKVGPYYSGPSMPQYNADGTPYTRQEVAQAATTQADGDSNVFAEGEVAVIKGSGDTK